MCMGLWILDVGHGNSSVLIDSGGIIIVDAGPGSALLEFLRRKEITKVDVLLISHADRDHIEGVIALLASEEVTLGKVRLNSDAMKGSDLWDDLLYILSKGHSAGKLDFDVSLTTRNSGDFNCGEVQVEILAPNLYIAGKGPGAKDRKDRTLSTNSVSAVIRLVRSGRALALLPGDIDAVGLANVVEDGADSPLRSLFFRITGASPGQRTRQHLPPPYVTR